MPNETNEIDERTIALMAAEIAARVWPRHRGKARNAPLAATAGFAVTLARQIAAEVQRTRPTGEETGR
jgi:hypothetical protein